MSTDLHTFELFILCVVIVVTGALWPVTRKYVLLAFAGVKLAVAFLLLPFFLGLFYTAPATFLVVFSALWPHLDILGEDGSLYLRRFFMTPKTQWFRPRFLHYINRSDEGREPHTHPDGFRTTILMGGYNERIYFPKNQVFRDTFGLFSTREARPGDTLDNPTDHTHMVTLMAPTWSWVVAWNRGKKWGFWRLDPDDASKDMWVESEAYGRKGIEVMSWKVWW